MVTGSLIYRRMISNPLIISELRPLPGMQHAQDGDVGFIFPINHHVVWPDDHFPCALHPPRLVELGMIHEGIRLASMASSSSSAAIGLS